MSYRIVSRLAPRLPLEKAKMKTIRCLGPSLRRGRGWRGALHRGFTLIEIVIVIVVIGLILRFALPGFSRTLRVGRVNRAAQVLSADLDRAFATAARQRRRR